MPSQQVRPTSSPAQAAGPSSETKADATSSGDPAWDYALSAGNSAVLSMIAGKVEADDKSASALLHGEADTATAGAESETEAAPTADVAPATTDPGGVYSKPFRNNQKRVAAAKVTLTATQQNELKVFQDNWVVNKGRYQAVSAKTGVPAELIAAIHYRESSLDFGTYLHQGDKLGKKAIHVPKNIPIFYVWEEAAVHALNMKKGLRDDLSMTEDTTDESALTSYAEAYNGLGYSNRGMASPYAYAGTDQYSKGLYVADGKFSRDAKDRRLGVLALTRGIDANGATDVHAGAAQDKRSAAQMWDAVLSGHVMRVGQSGPEVKELQKRLVAAGFQTGVDGDFGPGTAKAVKQFQEANGLPSDGVVGVDTAAAIDEASGGSPAATPPATATPGTGPTPTPGTTTSGPATDAPSTGTAPATDAPAVNVPVPKSAPGRAEWARVTTGKLTLQQNATGPVVSYLQGLLKQAGFTLDVDGDFGPGTTRAVRAFQKANNLRADGIVGQKTASRLG